MNFILLITGNRLAIFIIDLIILTGSFLVIALYKPATAKYLSEEYLATFAFLVIVWSASSFYFKKYSIKKKHSPRRFVRAVLMSNFVSMGVILVIFVLLWISGYSRLMLFGTIGMATLMELFLGNMYYSLIRTRATNGHCVLNPPPKPSEIRKARVARNFNDFTLGSDVVEHAVSKECGRGIYSFMRNHLDGECKNTLLVSTSSRFNVEMQPDNHYKAVVNMKRVNDINYINKFFESVNRKLPEGGIFIGCAETKEQRKKRILRKYPPVLNWAFYTLDYLLKRVFPKFTLTKKIYYILTRGNNRVISRAELLGRLYSCGFVLYADEFVNGTYCFCAKKIKAPVYDFNPTYGMFIKLKRVGHNGKIIRVYKLRTMHPYAEYLQNFVFENNSLEAGGKYKNDFRVTTLGKWLRTLWIDELPMLFNLLKGEVKLVGVRPLSMHYFSLYDESLQQERIKHKPGLIPPFYADMPKTLPEIQDSEKKYLEAYVRNPVMTDGLYFQRALWNIIFKKARSK
jgi:hypothetical protein